YSEDFSVFEQHKLLYMETDELEELRQWVQDRADYERQNILSELAGIPVNVKLRSEPHFSGAPPPDLSEVIDDYEARHGPMEKRESEHLFQTEDGEITLLVVWPKDTGTGLALSKQIIIDLRAAAEELDPSSFHEDMRVEIGGRIYNRVVQFEAVINDVKSSALWSFSLIGLLLTVYFRSLVRVLYLFIPLIMGIIWTMGLTQIVVGGLNLVTVFLVLIIFGLGIDFGIHNLSRYRESRAHGRDMQKSLYIILRHTGAASIVAGITTASGFYSLMITDFRAFNEFGFIAGTGIVLTFISMYTVLPSLLVLAEKLGIYRVITPQGSTYERDERHFPFKRQIVTMAVILASASIYFGMNVSFENNFGKLEAEKSDIHKSINDNIARVFPDGTDRAVLIVDTLDEVKAILDYFEKYIAEDTETPTIRKVESYYSLVPDEVNQEERLEIIREMHELLGDREIAVEDQRLGEGNWQDYLDIETLDPADLPEGLRRVYTGVSSGNGYLIYIFNSVTMHIAELAKQFSDDIREIEVDGKTYYPATESLIFVDMLALMKQDALKAILAVTFVTFLATFLFFRSFVDTLIVLSPTLLGMLMLWGVMGIFNIKLSIFNMIILPTVIGIGVDNGIHIFHRYKEETGDVITTLKTTGGAAAVTTITTMLGFAGMLSADMGGLMSLGILAVTGFATCLFASWTILPALLEIRHRPRRQKQLNNDGEGL
ncbi:MAG: MMPL family transporter, partial [Sphingomonadales bacterium]|nr:MMPL family transporter [Sphingomonadales bacterium]